MTETESITERNRAIVEAFFAAGNRRDHEAAMALMDDDIVIRQPEFLEWGGAYVGKSGFPELAAKMSKYIDMSSTKIERIVADGDVVFSIHRTKEADSDREALLAVQMTIRDGKLIENRVYYHQASSNLIAGL